MSALIGPEKAARILARCFLEQACICLQETAYGDDDERGLGGETAYVLTYMAAAYSNAADAMEAAMKAETTATP